MSAFSIGRRLLPVAAFVLAVACGPATGGGQQSPAAQPAAPKAAAPAEPAKPAAQPAAPKAAAPVEPAKPAAQPAKPVAQPAKPVAQPAAPAKPAASGEAKRLLLGSTDSASSQYPYWVAVGKAVNDAVPGVNVTVVASGATTENINRAQKGEFQFFLWTADAAVQAYRGLGPWQGKPIRDLRWLWVQRQTPIALVVREDSKITELKDLHGKDFNGGMRGSSTEKIVKDTVETLGVKPRWYTGGTEDALQAIKDKRIVGYGKTLAGVDTIDASILDLMTFTKIRVLNFSDDQAKKVSEAFPYYSFVRILPGVFKAYDWNKDAILTAGLIAGGGTMAALPEDVAYAIAKAVDQDQMPGGKKYQATAQKAIEPDFGKATVEAGVFVEPPLHPGAYRWYKERGLKVPDAIIPPEAKR